MYKTKSTPKDLKHFMTIPDCIHNLALLMKILYLTSLPAICQTVQLFVFFSPSFFSHYGVKKLEIFFHPEDGVFLFDHLTKVFFMYFLCQGILLLAHGLFLCLHYIIVLFEDFSNFLLNVGLELAQGLFFSLKPFLELPEFLKFRPSFIVPWPLSLPCCLCSIYFISQSLNFIGTSYF